MRFVRYALIAWVSVALFAGCRSQVIVPTAIATADGREIAPQGVRGDLLYVSDTNTSDVYVFSYPGGTLQQTLSGFKDPAGECVDKSGDVFITNTGASNIIEYVHGGTSPIATLKDPGYFPIGCAVDPTTGNLAVSNFTTTGSTQGDIVVYIHAKGGPKGNYRDSNINEMLLCGYDKVGNLFVDGLTSASAFAFAELPKGSKTLKNISLNQSISSGGGVQWDGKHVAIGDQTTNVIYQFTIGGSKGTKTGSTPLKGSAQVFQFWIAGTRVIGADALGGDAGIWKYPAGGSPLKKITGLSAPLGVTISE